MDGVPHCVDLSRGADIGGQSQHASKHRWNEKAMGNFIAGDRIQCGLSIKLTKADHRSPARSTDIMNRFGPA
jgi:hypothetical protein